MVIFGPPLQEEEGGAAQRRSGGSPPRRQRRAGPAQEGGAVAGGRGSPWIERELRALHAMCADGGEHNRGTDENASEVRPGSAGAFRPGDAQIAQV